MKNGIIILLLLPLTFFGFSQNIYYEVSGTYKRPIIKEELNEARTIIDINPGYPSSWISDHISMEISATCNGEVIKATSANDTLSNEQISILKMVELGTDITVDVKYYPKYSIIKEDIQRINFSYTVIPKIEAEYPGGYQQLKQYLKENAIDKISEPVATQIQLATVRFSINEEGQITDAQISETSGNEEIDKLLLQTINNMGKWNPAEDSNGTKVKQDFEFKVGNMVGC